MWPFKNNPEQIEQDYFKQTHLSDIDCDICGNVIGFACIDFYIGKFEILKDGRTFHDTLLGVKHYACSHHSRTELKEFIENK